MSINLSYRSYFTYILSLMPSRVYFIGFLLLLFFPFGNIKAQSFTQNNYTGYWTDSVSWINNDYPGLSILKNNIDCFGYITALSCLDINLSSLLVHDTLIINGNLYLKNKAYLQIDTGAILFIFGDLEINNQTEVLNSGTLVVAGNFRILGSPNQGSFKRAGGGLFIFDSTPEFPDGGNFNDLLCFNPDKYPDSCGYGKIKDLQSLNLYNFYSSLPFSRRTIDLEGNECFSYEIRSTETEICPDDTSIFTLVSVGINPSDSIMWNFGSDATPQIAYGFGPHEVIFSTPGQKTINLIITSDTAWKLKIPDILTVHDTPETGDIYLTTPSDANQTHYLDIACENSTREYAVNFQASSGYRWIIPALMIDTIGSSHISNKWNVAPGEYNISVQEISSTGCLGTVSESIVLVNECDVEWLFDQKTYTFSPNNDGINDTWVISNIDKYPLARIYVFNRTGSLVFKSEGDYMNDWDGTYNGSKLPLDSYYFMIDLKRYSKGEVKGILTILPIELTQ